MVIFSQVLIPLMSLSLDSSYVAFTTAFMMKSDGIYVDDLVGFLLQEEARHEHEHNRHVPSLTPTTSPISDLSTFATHRSSPNSYSNYNHHSVASPNRNTNTRWRRPMCRLCTL
uniref:Uncharacterized protein n=1 Tax=Lactuca sativa TaxID=4236 RepID=A0A9R1WB13_LACSA|nr:hypothetical protein LSAT_V11C300132340 [Lactuca sativa]